jgi:pyridoxine 5-phosphate synthase
METEMNAIRLYVNVDHVATIREARKTTEPDPLQAALIAERAGAFGITIHLREDRRHIQDHDVERIRQSISIPLNLEMAAVDEMVNIAIRTRPDQVSLVPEKRQEITTEGGLDVASQISDLRAVGESLKKVGILFSLFVDPELQQIDAAKEAGADSIEFNTGQYSEMTEILAIEKELDRLQLASRTAAQMGLRVFAGHGLTNQNVQAIAGIPEIEELNIGHHIISRAIFLGFDAAVKEMIQAIEMGRKVTKAVQG